MLRLLQRQGYQAHGHEISQHRIVESCAGLPISRGLLQHTPYEHGYFDAISSVECIEHIPAEDIPATFKEMGRILKVGGVFVFTLGPCYHVCSGFCSWSAIHPSGLCMERPRSWWSQQASAAGLVPVGGVVAARMLRALNVHSNECETKEGSQDPDCKAFNPDGHRFFIYTKGSAMRSEL